MHVKLKESYLLLNALKNIRDKRTIPPEFRKNLRRIGTYLVYEASKQFPCNEIEIETPLEKTVGHELSTDLVVISILRAALPMVDAIFEQFDKAALGVVSASRGVMKGEGGTEFEIVSDYMKIPEIGDKIVLIVDPMLATASTILFLLQEIIPHQPKKIVILAAIASKYGIDVIESKYPDIEIYCAAVDPILNDHGYIVPGLGDAGDRACNTNH